jgi:fused signal recognition particle receptor
MPSLPPWLSQQGPVGLPAWAWIAIAAAVVALTLFVVRARRRTGRVETKAPSLPSEAPKVELPPSEAEQLKRTQAEAAHKEAAELRRQREEKGRAAQEAEDAAKRAQIESEARALKEREEAAKKEEYRAKKAAEQEAKDRHRREEAEAARLRAEAAEQARQQAEQGRLAAEEEQRRRVQAQAGQTLAKGLEKTRTQGFVSKLNALFGQPKHVDEAVLGQLEEILFSADIGVRTASELVEFARDKLKKNELGDVEKMKSAIRGQIERILDLPSPTSLFGGGPPHVVMVVGVNGSGKTTTIGKLAAKATSAGRRVVIAAGDTFRAAAAEQLDVWAERAKAELIKGKESSDPGAVIFDAVKRARESHADLVIADTAGRLHTKAPLMEELKKVRRVMEKALPGAPHEVLLVLDSTTGQNAIQQAKQFKDMVGVTAIALTKLDGTAKGGVVIGICDELKLPVAWIGVGETVDDLQPFQSKAFVHALFAE